jgi:hypothetical protein
MDGGREGGREGGIGGGGNEINDREQAEEGHHEERKKTCSMSALFASSRGIARPSPVSDFLAPGATAPSWRQHGALKGSSSAISTLTSSSSLRMVAS